jgi:hypothetical protein
MNAYYQELSFELPPCNSGWLRVIDTSQPPGEDLPEEAPAIRSTRMPLCGRSLVLLAAASLMQGAEL